MLLDLVKKRRSIRKFQDKQIDKEHVEYLTKIALLSPSSRGLKPWDFIFVNDRVVLDQLATAKQGAGFLETAPLGIVVCADPRKCDVWIEDSSIAAGYLLLAAEDLGLGACWAQIRKRFHDPSQTANNFVKDLLGIPEYYEVEAIIGIGHADEEKPGYDDSDLDFSKILYNKFK